LSPDFKIREICSDNGSSWYNGDLNSLNITTALYSQLSAIAWSGPSLRVYSQRDDNKIQELVWQSGWSRGAVLPGNPLQGTSLAFIQRSLTSTPSIRGYYQEADLSLQEVCWDVGGWDLGTKFNRNSSEPFRTAIAAAVASSSPGADPKQMFVYHTIADGTVVQHKWFNGWSGPNAVPYPANVPEGRLAAVSFPRSGAKEADSRLYVNEQLNVITERIFRSEKWEPATSSGLGSSIAQELV